MTEAGSIWESKLSRLQDPNLEKMKPLVELMGELRERRQERGEPRSHALESVMNLLRNGLLMRKTGDRLRTELTEIFAFLCGFPAEFITRSRAPGCTLHRLRPSRLAESSKTRRARPL